MAYDLYIGDRIFSSWSLRVWLLFEKFNIPVHVHDVQLFSGTWPEQIAPLAPARRVPVIRTEDGMLIHDSLAIAEFLAETHPTLGLWPEDRRARTFARSLVAEVHSEFMMLKSVCPMRLDCTYDAFPLAGPIRGDVDRIFELWRITRSMFGSDTPWLFGAYSIADAFFAPIAARATTYGFEADPQAQAYITAHVTDPAFRRWRAEGLINMPANDPYPVNQKIAASRRPWPVQSRWQGEACACIGQEISACNRDKHFLTHGLEVDGVRFGFCNPHCRDMVQNDPEAWPNVIAGLKTHGAAE